jgi:hypothetical protein
MWYFLIIPSVSSKGTVTSTITISTGYSINIFFSITKGLMIVIGGF